MLEVHVRAMTAADLTAVNEIYNYYSRLGFEEVGRLREVGYKFERWLDVIYMQLPL